MPGALVDLLSHTRTKGGPATHTRELYRRPGTMVEGRTEAGADYAPTTSEEDAHYGTCTWSTKRVPSAASAS